MLQYADGTNFSSISVTARVKDTKKSYTVYLRGVLLKHHLQQ